MVESGSFWAPFGAGYTKEPVSASVSASASAPVSASASAPVSASAPASAPVPAPAPVNLGAQQFPTNKKPNLGFCAGRASV